MSVPVCRAHIHWLFTLWQLPKGQLGQQMSLKSQFQGFSLRSGDCIVTCLRGSGSEKVC